jgi:hypothetical protein
MANWDKLKSLIDQMHDELFSEEESKNADVEIENMKRFIKQYREELNGDINKEKESLKENRELGLCVNAIEQEGFVRGLMYALNNFNYFFAEDKE